MIDTSEIHSIRQMRMEGDSITHISETLGVSRPTVYKYLNEEDLSPRPPAHRKAIKKLDKHRALITKWLEDDQKNWREQRHTAKRIWERLRNEHGIEVGHLLFAGTFTTSRKSLRSKEICFSSSNGSQALLKLTSARLISMFLERKRA